MHETWCAKQQHITPVSYGVKAVIASACGKVSLDFDVQMCKLQCREICERGSSKDTFHQSASGAVKVEVLQHAAVVPGPTGRWQKPDTPAGLDHHKIIQTGVCR